MEINHELYAKKMLAFLVSHIKAFEEGDKYVTYGELAKAIDYPGQHKGSYFGKLIGKTLGTMGYMFDDLEIEGWTDRLPFIQALVVLQSIKLPSGGLKEFKLNYKELSKEKQKDFVKQEYNKIFQFGQRWYLVLKELGIDKEKYKNIDRKKYNPFGSEGSPEHKGLRDYIANNPSYIGLDFKPGKTEYPLKSGDSIDVAFTSDESILGVEVKSIRSGNDDMECGIFQCIKYREVLKAENVII